jgi:hypothetical protein
MLRGTRGWLPGWAEVLGISDQRDQALRELVAECVDLLGAVGLRPCRWSSASGVQRPGTRAIPRGTRSDAVCETDHVPALAQRAARRGLAAAVRVGVTGRGLAHVCGLARGACGAATVPAHVRSSSLRGRRMRTTVPWHEPAATRALCPPAATQQTWVASPGERTWLWRAARLHVRTRGVASLADRARHAVTASRSTCRVAVAISRGTASYSRHRAGGCAPQRPRPDP